MKCSSCGVEVSEFDVHCPSCEVRIWRPAPEEQFKAFGLDSSETEALLDLDPHTSAGEVAGNVFLLLLAVVWTAIVTLFDVLTLGQFDLGRQMDQASIERALRNSRR